MNSTEPPSPYAPPAYPDLRSRAIKACALFLLATCAPVHSCSAPAVPAPNLPWHLVWSDEFNAPNGTSPEASKWTFELGGNGFGNHELETYTNRPANARQQDGNLVITALKEDLTGPDGTPRHYTSARLRTQGHFAQAYGRFEARMQLPLGKGIWPAFWLLGDNIANTPWPDCGEIDTMENIGEASTVYSTLHGPGYSGGHALSAKFPLPADEAVNTAFHTYAVEWAPDDIKFFFDDHPIAHRTPADLPAGAKWAYNHPFFLLLNLAVGGDWPGNPDSTTAFPQRMLVDYVRVYTRDPAPPAPAAAPARHSR